MGEGVVFQLEKLGVAGQLVHVGGLLFGPAAAEENGGRCVVGEEFPGDALVVLADVLQASKVRATVRRLLAPCATTSGATGASAGGCTGAGWERSASALAAASGVSCPVGPGTTAGLAQPAKATRDTAKK
jgi:hypothetical protein